MRAAALVASADREEVCRARCDWSSCAWRPPSSGRSWIPSRVRASCCFGVLIPVPECGGRVPSCRFVPRRPQVWGGDRQSDLMGRGFSSLSINSSSEESCQRLRRNSVSCDADGDLMHPGGEHTAPLEALELVEDAEERLLRHFLDERREQRVIGRKPARKGHTEARAGSRRAGRPARLRGRRRRSANRITRICWNVWS